MDLLEDAVREERTVLESLFSFEEIEFVTCFRSASTGHCNETNADLWSSVTIKLKESLVLKFIVNEGYPAAPISFSLSGSLDPDVLKSLHSQGREVARRQAELREVAVFAVYSVIRGELDLLAFPESPQLQFAVSTEGEILTGYSPQSPNRSPPPLGVSLRFLLRLAKKSNIGGFDKWSKLKSSETTGGICGRLVVPVTNEKKCTYTALPSPMVLDGDVSPATCFVSHAWSCSFASLVTSLFGHQVGPKPMWALLDGHVDIDRMLSRLDDHLSQPGAVEHYYWIDIFSKNQHVVESDDTAEELRRTVSRTKEVLLVLNPLNDPVLLTRVWCLFEMCEALSCGTLITGVASITCMLELSDIIMKERSMTASIFHNKGRLPFHGRKEKGAKKSDDASPSAEFAGTLRRVLDACDAVRLEAIGNIDILTAQATVTKDRTMILSKIEETVGSAAMNDTARRIADDCIRHWQAGAIDAWALTRQSSRWEAAASALRQGGSPSCA